MTDMRDCRILSVLTHQVQEANHMPQSAIIYKELHSLYMGKLQYYEKYYCTL